MKNKQFLAGMIGAALLPYLVQLPYLLRAWRDSPPDRYDWGFLLLFAAGAIYLVCRVPAEAALRPDRRGWILMALAALFGAAGWWKEIHALQLAAATLFVWGTVWGFSGWPTAWRLLPVCGFLLLAIPGTSYHLSGMFRPWGLSGFAGKLLFAGGLAVWMELVRRHTQTPRTMSALFAGIFLAGIGAGFLPDTDLRTGPVLTLALERRLAGEFIGQEQPATDADRRFFGDSRIERHLYATNSATVEVLAVDRIADVHQIHPAGYCLLAGGWTIHRDAIAAIGGGFFVNEIEAERDGLKLLLWAWYASPDLSTGSFFAFRRDWSPKQQWRAYQISVAGMPSPLEARAVLGDLVRQLRAPGTAGTVRP